MISVRTAGLLAAALLSGCTSHRPAENNSIAALDSIVLERTPCYGTCPAYRLTVARGGAVRYLGRNVGDSTPALTATVSAAILDTLAARAAQAGFDQLPDTIANDRSLCVTAATDNSTIIVGLFGTRSKEVVYYLGCTTGRTDVPRAPALVRLAAFAHLIDSLTESKRWIRPDRLR